MQRTSVRRISMFKYICLNYRNHSLLWNKQYAMRRILIWLRFRSTRDKFVLLSLLFYMLYYALRYQLMINLWVWMIIWILFVTKKTALNTWNSQHVILILCFLDMNINITFMPHPWGCNGYFIFCFLLSANIIGCYLIVVYIAWYYRLA